MAVVKKDLILTHVHGALVGRGAAHFTVGPPGTRRAAT